MSINLHNPGDTMGMINRGGTVGHNYKNVATENVPSSGIAIGIKAVVRTGGIIVKDKVSNSPVI